ncbi:MAG: hypothetical protein EOM54_10065 [Clostridia bacterium]|nr:hypothetical protein [Clostridia bacterium]
MGLFKNKDSMKHAEKNEFNKLFTRFLIILFLIFLLLPKVINFCFMRWNVNTAQGLGNSEWLNFWGVYIGSIIGVIATLLAFWLSYNLNRKQYLDVQRQNDIIQTQNTLIQEQNRISRNLTNKQMRLQSLPFINVYRETNENLPVLSDIRFDNEGHIVPEFDSAITAIRFLGILIENIGSGPVIDLKVSEHLSLGHFSVNEKKHYRFHYLADSNVQIKIEYYDREGRTYQQTITISNTPCFNIQASTPNLTKDINPFNEGPDN